MEDGRTLTDPPASSTTQVTGRSRIRWTKAETQIQIICCLFIALFVYTGVSKLLDMKNFALQISRSPVLGTARDYSAAIAWLLPLSELLVAVFLIIPTFRVLSLWLAVGLMTLFTGYIIVILNFAPYVPCICGGVLQTLGWEEHLAFNLSFIVIGVWAIRKHMQHVREVIRK